MFENTKQEKHHNNKASDWVTTGAKNCKNLSYLKMPLLPANSKAKSKPPAKKTKKSENQKRSQTIKLIKTEPINHLPITRSKTQNKKARTDKIPKKVRYTALNPKARNATIAESEEDVSETEQEQEDSEWLESQCQSEWTEIKMDSKERKRTKVDWVVKHLKRKDIKE